MNYLIFDTETISVTTPFCYNVGIAIFNSDSPTKPIAQQEWVSKEVWNNSMLFQSAYYTDKRPIYTSRMKGRKAVKKSWAEICEAFAELVDFYDVQFAYAYNSKFDEQVFSFNCEWFKASNPLESITVLDIRGYAHKFICFTEDFQNFCNEHERYTETGNYSTTAETLFQFISNNSEFAEEHTALSDSLIEGAILAQCLEKGATLGESYKVYATIPRNTDRNLTLNYKGDSYNLTYQKISIAKDRSKITIK